MSQSEQETSIDTVAFWSLLDRYRESPTAQRTAVANALIALIDGHTAGVVAAEIVALVHDVDRLCDTVCQLEKERDAWIKQAMCGIVVHGN